MNFLPGRVMRQPRGTIGWYNYTLSIAWASIAYATVRTSRVIGRRAPAEAGWSATLCRAVCSPSSGPWVGRRI